MVGETDLDKLIGGMSAELVDGLYVFATIADGVVPTGVKPKMLFQEAEGLTLILLEEEAAEHELSYEFTSRMITLNIHSALEAVGFLARITTHLAKLGMGVNPVSGFYHDHLFVPDGREHDAISALEQLAANS